MKKFKNYFYFAIVAIFLVLISLYINISVDNKEISLRKQFNAQYDVTKTAHDEMWKIIKQSAETSNKYYEDFQKIFPELINSRYGNDNQVIFKWLQEDNPEYTPELYSKLMNSISTERAKFKRAQDICIDVAREYETYINKKHIKWLIDDNILDVKNYINMEKEEALNIIEDEITKEVYLILTYKPVTSTKTEDIFKKGVDDDVELF